MLIPCLENCEYEPPLSEDPFQIDDGMCLHLNMNLHLIMVYAVHLYSEKSAVEAWQREVSPDS
jgi:hypothetical protein